MLLLVQIFSDEKGEYPHDVLVITVDTLLVGVQRLSDGAVTLIPSVSGSRNGNRHLEGRSLECVFLETQHYATDWIMPLTTVTVLESPVAYVPDHPIMTWPLFQSLGTISPASNAA